MGAASALALAGHRIHPVRIPYRRPVTWHSTSESAADFILLELRGDSGHAGVAEATAKPTWSGASLRTLAAALEDIFLPRLAGADLAEPASVAAAIGRIPDNSIAKALVHSACLDLRAAATGTPPWRRWGGTGRVALSWTVSRQAPAAMAREAAEMVDSHGFATLKVKGGQGPETDLRALAEIRAAVGPEVAIYVDANQAYDRAAAAPYVQDLAARGVAMVEDPYPLRPDEDFRAFQARCPIPVLVDAGCRDAAAAESFLAAGALALGVKPGRMGLVEARRCVAAARAQGRTAVPGLFGETDFGALLNAQLPGTAPEGARAWPAEFSFHLMMRESLLRAPPRIEAGVLHLPDAAGLAALIDWDAVARLRPA